MSDPAELTKIIQHDDDITDSDLFRETMRSFIFENENIIYLGILILIISIFKIKLCKSY